MTLQVWPRLKQAALWLTVLSLAVSSIWLTYKGAREDAQSAAWRRFAASLPLRSAEASEPLSYRGIQIGMPMLEALAALHNMFGRVHEIENNSPSYLFESIRAKAESGEFEKVSLHTEANDFCPFSATPEALKVDLIFTKNMQQQYVLSSLFVQSSYSQNPPLFQDVMLSASQRYGRPLFLLNERRKFQVSGTSGLYQEPFTQQLRVDALVFERIGGNTGAWMKFCMDGDEADPPSSAARIRYFQLGIIDSVALEASEEQERKRLATSPPSPPPLPSPPAVRF